MSITRERLEALRSLVLNELPDACGVRVVDRQDELGGKKNKDGGDVARLFIWALANSTAESLQVELPPAPVFFAQLDYERGSEPRFLNPTDYIEAVASLQLYVAETRQMVHVFDTRQYASADGLMLDCVLLEYNPKAHALLCKYGAIQGEDGGEQGGGN